MVFSSSCTSNCIFIWSYLHRTLSFFRNTVYFFICKLDFFKRQTIHEVRTLKSQIINQMLTPPPPHTHTHPFLLPWTLFKRSFSFENKRWVFFIRTVFKNLCRFCRFDEVVARNTLVSTFYLVVEISVAEPLKY